MNKKRLNIFHNLKTNALKKQSQARWLREETTAQ